MHPDLPNSSQPPRPIVVAAQLIIFVTVCAILYWGQFILVPVSLAILCAFVLQPGVTFLERRRVNRTVAVAVLMAIALGLVSGLGWIFGSQLSELLSDVPKYRENIKEKLAGFKGLTNKNKLADLQQTIKEVDDELDVEAQEGKPPEEKQTTQAKEKEEAAAAVPVKVVAQRELFEFSLKDLDPYFNLLFKFAFVVLLTTLFLYWREDLVERLVGLAGRARMVVTTNALSDAGVRISRFLGLQFAVNVCYGLVASLGLYLLGVPYAVVWGASAGLLRYIPWLGSILGTLTATLAAVLTLPGWQPVLWVFLFYVTMDTLVNLAEPFIFGARLGVSVLAVLLSVVVLGWLWGPVGAILATPFAACLVVLGEYVPGLAFLGWLMSKDPRLDPRVNFYHRLLRHDLAGATRILLSSSETATSDRVAIETIVAPTIGQILTDVRAGALSKEDAEWIGDTFCSALEELAPEQDPDEEVSHDPARLVVCPPSSALDVASLEALTLVKRHLTVDLNLSHRGRLISEVLEDLQAYPARALLLVASTSDEKRQLRRWRRHLRQAGLDLDLLLFEWSEETGRSSESELLDAGATAIVHGLDGLNRWIRDAPTRSSGPASSAADESGLPLTTEPLRQPAG